MSAKRCYTCCKIKPFDQFSFRSKSPDGRNSQCRACFAAYYAKWREANAEKVREQQREYCAANAEKQRAKTRAWKLANTERAKANDKRLRSENATRYAEKNRAWRQENADRIRERKREYAEKNRQAIRARNRAYRQANKGRVLADLALRKARKRQATPTWLTAAHRAEMSALYSAAVARSEQTGTPHHVDHIVPISSPLVCGLHVPWNLQILTAAENLAKGNTLPA